MGIDRYEVREEDHRGGRQPAPGQNFQLVSLASALLLALAALPCTALAAEAGDTEPAQGAPPPAALYPAEVRTSEENGMIRLEKVYYLSTRDDPAVTTRCWTC